MESLEPTVSVAWSNQKRNVRRIFALFQSKNQTLPESLGEWDELPEEVLCSREVYDHFEHFLAKEYLPDIDDPTTFLTPQVAISYLSSIINDASAKFKATGGHAVKLFFTCLDTKASTDEAKWLRGIKKIMENIGFARAKESGEKQDGSQTPLYREQLIEVSAALAKKRRRSATSLSSSPAEPPDVLLRVHGCRITP